MTRRTIQVLHLTDTHLGYRQYGLIEREKDIYEAFREAIEIAARERVDAVIHTGDFFDTTRPPPQSYKVALESLAILREKSIPFIAIPGDHDIPKRLILAPLTLIEDLGYARVLGLKPKTPYETTIVKTRSGELHITGIRAHRGAEADIRLPQILQKLSHMRVEVPSILALHQCLSEVSPFYEISLGQLPRNFSYYAMGHLHLYRELNLGESKVIYPGSIEALKIDEAQAQQDRYVVVVEIDSFKTISRNKIKLESVRPQPVYEITYSSIEELRRDALRIRKELLEKTSSTKKPLLQVRVEKVPSDIKKRVYDELDRIFRDITLQHRIVIEAYTRDLPPSIQDVKGVVDIESILLQLLGDQKKVEIALDLIKTLGSETGKYAEKEAELYIRKVLLGE